MDKYVLKQAILAYTFAPGNHSRPLSNHVFLTIQKATYQVSVGHILTLCGLNFSSYMLQFAERGLKKIHFRSFHDILTPITLNLYTVLSSNWNSINCMERFFLGIKKEHQRAQPINYKISIKTKYWGRKKGAGEYIDRLAIGAVLMLKVNIFFINQTNNLPSWIWNARL